MMENPKTGELYKDVLCGVCGHHLEEGLPLVTGDFLGVTAEVRSEGEVSILFRPQVDIFIKRIIVPDYIGPHFAISQFRIGHYNQFVTGHPVAADAFTRQRMKDGPVFDKMANAGMDLRLDVINTSDRHRRFDGYFWIQEVNRMHYKKGMLL